MGTLFLAEVFMKKITLRNLKHAVKAAEAAKKQPNPVIEADAKLVQDRSTTRAHFQGRFRKTTFGDFKNRLGRAYEQSEALQDDYVFNQAKEEAALEAAAVIEAAAADGVVVEEPINMPKTDEGKIAG